jgi:hypothetical protein
MALGTSCQPHLNFDALSALTMIADEACPVTPVGLKNLSTAVVRRRDGIR